MTGCHAPAAFRDPPGRRKATWSRMQRLAPAVLPAAGPRIPRAIKALREGPGAYRESSNEQNIPYDPRFGFDATGQIDLRSGPPGWTMWRGPRPART